MSPGSFVGLENPSRLENEVRGESVAESVLFIREYILLPRLITYTGIEMCSL